MANILVIDDDPAIRDLLTIHMEEAGHTVTHAVNGQDGISQAGRSDPDLIILDINMPVMDGTRVLQALRSPPETSKVPVIALSAVGGAKMGEDMHQMGCDGYVVKPINFDVLCGKIKKLLNL